MKNNKPENLSGEARRVDLRAMIFTAVMAAVICVAAPWSIPMPGLVPISLATFAVYLAGALLGAKRSTIAVILYILIGLVGLPVFSGFSGGFAKLLGVTGGYIIGYIPCAVLTGIFSEKSEGKPWMLPLGMILGTLSLYAFGTVWFLVATNAGSGEMITGGSIIAALMSCVVPFLPGDALKIAASCAVALPLRSRVKALFGEL